MAVVSVLFMIFMGIVFLFPATPQTNVQDMNYTVVVLGGVLLLSLGWYYFPKYGGVHWFTGPVSNVVGHADDERRSVDGTDSEKHGREKGSERVEDQVDSETASEG